MSFAMEARVKDDQAIARRVVEPSQASDRRLAGRRGDAGGVARYRRHHKAGLIEAGWEKTTANARLLTRRRFVFVVRKGNPKGIKDWSDLVKGDVKIITPNPKTSGTES